MLHGDFGSSSVSVDLAACSPNEGVTKRRGDGLRQQDKGMLDGLVAEVLTIGRLVALIQEATNGLGLCLAHLTPVMSTDEGGERVAQGLGV